MQAICKSLVRELKAPFFTGTTAAKGLATLPDGGASSYGNLGRADARPSPGMAHLPPWHDDGEGARRSTRRWRAFPRGTTAAKGLAALPAVARVPTGTLAEHPPSPRLRRTRTLGPPPASYTFPRARRRRRVSPPYRAWRTFLRARRRRRVSPPYQTSVRFPTGTLAEQTLGSPRAISGRGADGPGFWRRPCRPWPWRRPWRCRRTSCRGTGCSCPPGRGRVRA